ncbi:fumarylacetoacetate hydrolase family protein [Paenarthrobacter sp. NPDC090522]|uniref:fumarylacetoacetate hydrolase family protein n=1 Tax=Paenarthrobacter sp. NPDC090522 TaxID=3364383 RepID=UPI003820AAE8
MRLANVAGRATLVLSNETGADVHQASNGRFGPGLPDIFETWPEFVEWVRTSPRLIAVPFRRQDLQAPSPEPGQIFAIGMNYGEHAREVGLGVPEGFPPVFTKFRSSLSGPDTQVALPPSGKTDWEVELVVVIGRITHDVQPENAWEHVAGLTVGQDLSERITQMRPPSPQFSLGKSYPGFAPTGPWLVSADDLDNRDDLGLGSELDGETVQASRTSDLLFSVPELVSGLSRILTLYPGDLIFTGTPSGVGTGRTPERFIQPGQHLRSWIHGIGELHQSFA